MTGKEDEVEKSEDTSSENDAEKKKKNEQSAAKGKANDELLQGNTQTGEMSAKRSARSDAMDKNLIVETPDFHAKSISGATEGAGNND